MREDGILKKLGTKYTVTKLGREMLSEEAINKLVKSWRGRSYG